MESQLPIITTKSVRSSLIRCIFDWSPLVFWLHLFVLHWCSLFCWFVLFPCLFFFTCLLSMKDLCHCLHYPSFLLEFFSSNYWMVYNYFQYKLPKKEEKYQISDGSLRKSEISKIAVFLFHWEKVSYDSSRIVEIKVKFYFFVNRPLVHRLWLLLRNRRYEVFHSILFCTFYNFPWISCV